MEVISEKQDDFCSSFYKVGQLYEYYSNDLRQEIFERRKYNIPYNESEIWYIIDSLVSVASYLKYKEVTHGDIRPYNVFIDQIGQIKLGEQYSHPQTYSLYSQLLMGTTDDFFVSPQCLNGLRAHQEFPDFDRSKNEVFSIGMTALNAATLQDTNKECYDISQLTLNRENVQNLLQRVKFQFSQNLSTTIENMLLHSQEQRASLEEILDITNAQSNKAQSLSIVEVFQNEQPNPYDNNKVIEANNLIVEQPKVNYITRDFTNDDLMARIQKVLAESDQSQPVSNINNSMITNTAINTNFTPNYVDQQLYRTINITPNIVQENRISQYVSEDNEAVKKSKKSTNIQDYVPISESQNNKIISDVRAAQQLGNNAQISQV
ncbi:protein kinase domain protein [Ichthyophthirius multifiliis]|uniref:Protein kinase domain protein n=1 Tax=Ichthyophthirius multifiliis TaxID=5932 RepID=G0QU50_ICHMU|nr:protein kinase domain protein [Ichthyophthirius multifiliis]EGR31274.1 protein kinase domain protein [Ichthyophthirius multifiliis]|eukprot:XP_004034760.1 protein kinase domain protein [Ichthyophthirius multifiliis]